MTATIAKNSPHILAWSLLLLASASMAAQSPPAPATAACTPCKLEIGPGVPPVYVTYELAPAPVRQQRINQLVVTQGGNAVQKLKIHGEVVVSPDDPPLFRGVDLNADGFQDIEFITSRGVANAYADYWLYNVAQKQFSYLGNYPVFTIDPQTHRLRTYERNGEGGMSYSAKQYAFQDGKLELMRSETQEEAKTYGLFRLTVKERVHGVLKTTTQKTVKPPA